MPHNTVVGHRRLFFYKGGGQGVYSLAPISSAAAGPRDTSPDHGRGLFTQETRGLFTQGVQPS
jgi:hypothetical protein